MLLRQSPQERGLEWVENVSFGGKSYPTSKIKICRTDTNTVLNIQLSDGRRLQSEAAIAQLGERQTEDLEVPGSIPGYGIFGFCLFLNLGAPRIKGKSMQKHTYILMSGVAQWLACWAHNSKVGGSKPLSAKLFSIRRS